MVCTIYHLLIRLSKTTKTTLEAYYRINSSSWTQFYEGAVGDYDSQEDHIVGVNLNLNEGDEIELYFRMK